MYINSQTHTAVSPIFTYSTWTHHIYALLRDSLERVFFCSLIYSGCLTSKYNDKPIIRYMRTRRIVSIIKSWNLLKLPPGVKLDTSAHPCMWDVCRRHFSSTTKWDDYPGLPQSSTESANMRSVGDWPPISGALGVLQPHWRHCTICCPN